MSRPPHKPLDLKKVRTYPLRLRPSKVNIKLLARPFRPGGSLRDFLDRLPDVLAARDLRTVIAEVARAAREEREVILGIGSHAIKVGLNPIIIDLMEKGVITCLAMNGSGIIHDFELAFAGKTSEEVDRTLEDGSFGMAAETGQILNGAITEGVRQGLGIGEAVGRRLSGPQFRFRRMSLAAAGVRLGIPVTVHVAVGTDIIHMHPSADGAATGEGSLRDFHRLAAAVARLRRGVYINLGSAVILPEVFLKALSLARNLGHRVDRFTTVNLDFIQHYRPLTNVVRRPTQGGGRGYAITGHHEILFPLLAAGILEARARTR